MYKRQIDHRLELIGAEALGSRTALEATVRTSILLRITLAVALAGAVAGCQTEERRIPTLTAQAASQLPPSQLPVVFKDPDPLVPYPYNIHETDGLSRNPDDCAKWGCVDVGGGNM